MQINRELQHSILQALVHSFPSGPNIDIYDELISKHGEKEVIGNVLYLSQHQLIQLKEAGTLGQTYPSIIWQLTKPTAKGIDFLADDGGLSAILGVVTVKLHSDTIRALLATKIDQADILSEEKSRLKTALGKVGDTVLAKITEKAIDAIPVAAAVTAIQAALN